MPFSENAITILAATPGTPFIPAPTTETFAQFSQQWVRSLIPSKSKSPYPSFVHVIV